MKDKLELLPHAPWVYKMLWDDGKCIYVGKAKDLKKRVSSYFQSKDLPVRTQKMVEHICDIDYIEVNSEIEALLLETNLIKELKPKYNILLKDGKNFCYVKITLADRYPRVDVVRSIHKDWSKYYGPKASSQMAYDTIKVLQEIYPIVSNNIYWVNWYPKKVDYSKPINSLPEVWRDEYLKAIGEVVDFFEWKFQGVHDALKRRMMEYASQKQFEMAARIRDYLKNFELMHAKQLISEPRETYFDVFGYVLLNERTYVTLFQVRNGKIVWNENLTFSGNWNNDEFLESLIVQYYALTSDIPKEILLPESIESVKVLESWLENNVNRKVKVVIPSKWKKSELVLLAEKNAQNFAVQYEDKESKDKEKLKQAFSDINTALFGWVSDYWVFKCMEAYDISHFAWTNTVWSISVMKNGIKSPKFYRHYNIKTLWSGDIDDFKAIYEVLSRRIDQIKPLEEPNNGNNAKYILKKIKWEQYYDIYNWDTSIGKLFVIEKDICELETQDRDFLLEGWKLLAWKQVWIASNDEILMIEAWYKKYKEVDENFQVDHWLVPEKVANRVERISGGFYMRKFEKAEKEVLLPSFILIDGGKWQLNAAVKAFVDKGWEVDGSFVSKNFGERVIRIFVCSIAKKLEEIFYIWESDARSLPKECEGSYMLQRLRDEAHRFALTHQKKKRSKETLSSAIDKIPGVGEVTKYKLLQKFGSLKWILAASDDELLTVCNRGVLEKIRSFEV